MYCRNELSLKYLVLPDDGFPEEAEKCSIKRRELNSTKWLQLTVL
jgi:hypothetical protein